jgi:hypothetical protein
MLFQGDELLPPIPQLNYDRHPRSAGGFKTPILRKRKYECFLPQLLKHYYHILNTSDMTVP